MYIAPTYLPILGVSQNVFLSMHFGANNLVGPGSQIVRYFILVNPNLN